MKTEGENFYINKGQLNAFTAESLRCDSNGRASALSGITRACVMGNECINLLIPKTLMHGVIVFGTL